MKKTGVWRDVVVLGGSGGALEALTRIVGALPSRFPGVLLAVVTTPDHGPTHPELADLRSRTAIAVAFASNGDVLAPGRMYVCPPSAHMTIDAKHRIALVPAKDSERPDAPVDALFQSAAAAFGARVVAVVLSGGNDDGLKGLSAVGEAGGVAIVQSPVDAIDAHTPINAVVGDHPDAVPVLEAIAPLLMKLTGTLR